MRLRVLLSGLSFFAAALAIGWGPVLAHGHPLDASGACTQTGTSADDFLVGTAGRDVLCGRGGDDTLAGAAGADVLRGGLGHDRLEGGAGRDGLFGGPGNDVFYAYDGAHDHLDGGTGRDRARKDALDALRRVEATRLH